MDMDNLALARLLRVAGELGLSDATRAHIRGILLEKIEPAATNSNHLEQRLRQMVERNVNWAQMAETAWILLQNDPSPLRAARLIELAFLHGSSGELEEVLTKLVSRSINPLENVHPTVRALMTAGLWREKRSGGLTRLLLSERDATFLLPIERLFVFKTLATAKDSQPAYVYFKRYRQELMQAAKEVGAQIGLSDASFLLTVGQVLLDLGHEEEGRFFLEQIAEGSPERAQAAELLWDGKNKDSPLREEKNYQEILSRAQTARERVQVFKGCLEAVAGQKEMDGGEAPALRKLLKEPLSWFEADEDAIQEFADLLVNYRHLEEQLPTLLSVFRENIANFATASLDHALWSAWLPILVSEGRDEYYKGVALLHYFVAGGPSCEIYLWQAKELIEQARKHWRSPIPYLWRDLHKSASAWVARSGRILESDRNKMLRQLRVCVESDVLAIQELEEYLAQTEQAPLCALQTFQSIALARGARELEGQLILKAAERSHLTNQNLDRLWSLACLRQEHDLAWRIASILQVRQGLSEAIQHAWEISGEKRSSYAFVVVSLSAVEKCLKSLPPHSARLAHACVQVGHLIPELLMVLSQHMACSKMPAAAPDSLEARVDKGLTALPWLTPGRKRFRLGFEIRGAAVNLPAFAQVLPSNLWSILVARLSECLGLHTWGWKLSYLNDQLAGLIPRLSSKQDLGRYSAKVAKWLKALSPEQRAAWQDLSMLSKIMKDDEAELALGCFVTRLATMILQNHTQALVSLQTMRAPVAVIWDLERFLLSGVYSALRREMGTLNRVLVPNSLQRLTTIVSKRQ